MQYKNTVRNSRHILETVVIQYVVKVTEKNKVEKTSVRKANKSKNLKKRCLFDLNCDQQQ